MTKDCVPMLTLGPRAAPLRRVLLGLALLCALGAQAQAPDAGRAEAEAVVRSFHEALRSGDGATVRQLLATDAVIIEAGRLESREEYLAHHLAADIEFAKAVPSRRLGSQTTVQGETAWVSSTSTTSGRFRDRPVRLAGAELVVLTRRGASWEIRAVHWSSYQPK